MNTMITDLYRGELLEIAAIEYRRVKLHRGRRWWPIPFSVFTVTAGNTDGWISALFDWEWCRRDQCFYYHCSGAGGRFYLHRCCGPVKTSVWWNPKLVRPTDGGKSGNHFLSAQTLKAWNYRVETKPLAILGEGCNPFEVRAEESNVRYCTICKDHLPSEDSDPCDHLTWCQEHAGWMGPGYSEGEGCQCWKDAGKRGTP